MATELFIQEISIVVALLTVIIADILTRHRERRIAKREIYQQLELASAELFRFEAEHIEFIRPLWEKQVPIPKVGTAEYIAFTNYICQILNLFEIAIRFRKDRIISPEIFGTWVIWFYDVCEAPHFSDVWDRLRYNYSSELRSIIDMGIDVAQTTEEETAGKKAFYDRLSKILKCRVIEKWYENIQIEQNRPQLAPLSVKKTTEPASSGMQINWCLEKEKIDDIVEFFISNLNLSYISHGEVQEGRAIDFTRWSEKLPDVIGKELLESIPDNISALGTKRVVLAMQEERLVGCIIVEVHPNSGGPLYATIHDLIVEKNSRRSGLGQKMLAWLEEMLMAEHVRLLFLETGIHNESAHAFFKRMGFTTCSYIMVKEN